MIEGQKVYFRALERDDISRMHAWVNDPELCKYLLFVYPVSLENETAWFESQQKDECNKVYGIVDRKTGRHIGNIGLHNINWISRNAELGIFIGEKDYLSKGFGTDAVNILLLHAFSTLNLHMVYLNVFEYNKRAIRSYEKCGFKVDGISRDAHFEAGSYHNIINMSILKNEFSSKKC